MSDLTIEKRQGDPRDKSTWCFASNSIKLGVKPWKSIIKTGLYVPVRVTQLDPNNQSFLVSYQAMTTVKGIVLF